MEGITGVGIFAAYVWGSSGLFSAVVASAKGRSVVGWLLLGVLFGLVGLVAIAGLPEKRASPQGDNGQLGESSTDGLVAVVSILYLAGIALVWFYFSR